MQIKLINEQTHASKDHTVGGGGGDSDGGIAVSSAINGEISVIAFDFDQASIYVVTVLLYLFDNKSKAVLGPSTLFW